MVIKHIIAIREPTAGSWTEPDIVCHIVCNRATFTAYLPAEELANRNKYYPKVNIVFCKGSAEEFKRQFDSLTNQKKNR